MKRALIIIFALVLLIGIAFAEDFFKLPENIKAVESEAFANLKSESVFIPRSVISLSDDAFGESVKNVYGYLNSEAERYAKTAGKNFIPADVLNLSLGQGTYWTYQSNPVSVKCEASTNVGSLTYSISVEKDGAVYYQSDKSSTGSFQFAIADYGTYDIIVNASNTYDDTSKRFSGALVVDKGVGFKDDAILLDVGESKPLLSEDETRAVEILSYDKSIVSVSNRSIKGIKTGDTSVEARITLSDGRQILSSCKVKVGKAVTSVSINAETHIYPQETTKLNLSLKPTDALQTDVAYSSSDESVLTVDKDGNVTAHALGSATITATAHSGVSASIVINAETPAEQIVLPEIIYVGKGETLAPDAIVLPENAYDKNLTWTSTNNSIVGISAGKLKGVAAGECTVTATTHNGIIAQCTARVIIPVTSVKLDKSSATVDLFAEYQLSATVLPNNADIKDLTWTSSDEEIASVDENGLVSALKSGSCTITATSINGKSASCKLTIVETKPTSVEFASPFVTLKEGEEAELILNFKPEKAQNKNATYLSSDESVATVDENGIIHAHSTGSTIITAISESVSSVKNTCKVFVVSENALPLEGVVIGINPGHQQRPINTMYPQAPGSTTLKRGCGVGTAGIVTKTPEYVVTLDVSLMLRDILEANGATVIMTRTTNDAYLTNIERADILNAANVDAAIQVHCNGGGESAYGMSSYYKSTGDYVQESKYLAECLLSGMLDTTSATNKGCHIYNLYMSLNWSFTPASLVELGYLTNRAEEQLLIDPDYQYKLAMGMYEGLLEYFGR